MSKLSGENKKEHGAILNTLLKLLGAVIISISLITLTGWITGFQNLICLKSYYVPMPITNCVFFVFYGLVFVLTDSIQSHKILRVVIILIICFCSLYGILQFLGSLLSADINYDYVLFRGSFKVNNFTIGHISPYSGLIFFLSGFVIILSILSNDRQLSQKIIAGIGITVSFAGFVGVVGYLLGTPLLYAGNLIPLSFKSAILFVFLGSGLILIPGKEAFFLRLFVGPTSSARILRVLIPINIALLLIQGFLDIYLTHKYKINPALVTAFMTISTVALFTIMIINVTKTIFKSANKAEAERLMSEFLLKELACKLKESNDAKDKLFSIIAHDLRTPFNSILGYFELLDEQYENFTEDEKKMFRFEVKKSTQNTYNFLNTLLIWSRSQTDGIKVNPANIDLAEAVERQMELLKDSAIAKKINLSSTVVPGTKVYADNVMVDIILFNLISNAVKFTRENGIITISSKRRSNEVYIEVSDNGIGIARTDHENLFKSNKMHSTLGTCNEKGTGLGLVICKEFTERSKGKIWAESELGKGSRFIFTLPL